MKKTKKRLPRMTPQEIAKYADKEGAAHAAHATGLTLAEVRDCVRKYSQSAKNVAARKKRREMAEYAAKHGMSDSARHFGVPVSQVKACLDEFEIEPAKTEPNVHNATSFVILKRVLDGEKQADIARSLNCTRQWVSSVVQRARDVGFDV